MMLQNRTLQVRQTKIVNLLAASAEHVTFAYESETILDELFPKWKLEDYRYPWSKRFRKIYAIKIIDAVLGCQRRKRIGGRCRCA